MPDSIPIENDFLKQLIAVIEKNVSNEQFGVSELADQMNMSRSNLLRKVKKLTNLSVSQLISQVRLQRGMELLKTSSFNVSEISHQVGFSSTSYFIKCFREYYGYPPGEVGKREAEGMKAEPAGVLPETVESLVDSAVSPRRSYFVMGSVALIVALAIGAVSYFTLSFSRPGRVEKSIAILPFKNDSNDSSNVYLINGLMESTLNNLQKIGDLQVTSRTSAEKYRNTAKSIPEMAKELNVNYFVEGSGQKIGDKIVLNIQLIEASTDRHLWAHQYRKEVTDIFELQEEIAKNIADEIQIYITPEEERKIEKKPTEDLVAYDYYLKGRDLFYKSGRRDLEASIPYFKKAIGRDNKFALAYANAAMVYYYLDYFQAEKRYSMEIISCADKAMASDPKLSESLIAKGLSYAHKKEFEVAVPYLEKALDADPNSGITIHFLSEFYSIYLSNPSQYLKYALKGVQLDLISLDSTTTSFKYFHLANALMQAGFMDEALQYINKSLEYNPDSPFAGYVKIFILYGKNKNLQEAKDRLQEKFKRDPMRIDVLQEIGKLCYVMRDYDSAYFYYKKFVNTRKNLQLDVFIPENLKIAFVFYKVGLKTESEEFVKIYKNYVDHDRTSNRQLLFSHYYAYLGDQKKAIEHLELYSKEDNFQHWILYLPDDPIMESVKDHAEFKRVMKVIETKFWNTNKVLRKLLEENRL